MKKLVSFAILFVLCGCQTSAPPVSAPPPGAHLSSAQAVAIARQAAVERKVDLRKYKPPMITFMPGEWGVVWPKRVSQASNECYEVVVDEKSGRIVDSREQWPERMPLVSTSTLSPDATKAIAIATQGAAEHKVDLREYKQPIATFAPGQWYIAWPDQASNKYFEVIIDDKTGKVISTKEAPFPQMIPSASTKRMPPDTCWGQTLVASDSFHFWF